MECRRVLAAPDAPDGLIPDAGDQQVSLTWTAPAFDGGVPITDYKIQFSEDSGQNWTSYDDGVSTELSAVVVGLTNGLPYVFQVAAVNVDGEGLFSTVSTSATPAGLPGIPTDLTPTPDDGQVTLTWTAPDGNGAEIISYVIEITDDSLNIDTQTFDADPLSTTQTATVVGLTNGSSYVFRVAAVNGQTVNGQTQGEYSDATGPVTPSALPATPIVTGVAVAGGVGDSGQVTVTWDDLKADDDTIASYVLEFRPEGGDWVPVEDLIVAQTPGVPSYTVTGLTDGTPYTFRVAAKTQYDRQGEFSTESAAVIPSPQPTAPIDLVVVGGDGSALLTWTAAEGFGALIDHYIVQVSVDDGATWDDYPTDEPISIPSLDMPDLENGYTYLFRVYAVNEYGRQSEFSVPTDPITLIGAPDTPANLVVQSTDRGVKLSWTDPAQTGGLPITGYKIQYQRIEGSVAAPLPGKQVDVLLQPVRSGANLTLKVPGLVNGALYSFSIVTLTGDGNSKFSSEDLDLPVYERTTSQLVMPLAAVGKVYAKAAPGSAGEPASVALAWTAPRLPRGVSIVDYTIQYSSDAGQTWQTAQDGVSRAVTTKLALENGKTYIFKVAAQTMVVGDTLGITRKQGDFSAISMAVTPFVKNVVAEQPTGLTAESLRGAVQLSWTAPAVNEGGAAVRYVVQYRLEVPSAKWIQVSLPASSLTSATISRLGVGKSYTFRIAAVNQAGQGVWSDLLTGVLA